MPDVQTNPYAACPVNDPAALSALYDNNASPRNEADLKALQACSAAALRSSTHVHRRVAWGLGDCEWVDLFTPPQQHGPVPALVFVHGGRWELNTSTQTAFWAQACCDAGLGFVGLNFQKLSQLGLPAQVAQVAAAWSAVQAQAGGLGLDAGALVLAGHSSGAHLALAALLQHPPAALPQALLLLGGIYDLQPLLATTHQAALGFSQDVAASCSPLSLLAAGHGQRLRLPHTLVAVGAEESAEFIRQSQALHWALQAHTTALYLAIPGTAHFDAALSFNLPGSPLLAFVLNALKTAGKALPASSSPN